MIVEFLAINKIWMRNDELQPLNNIKDIELIPKSMQKNTTGDT
jgi:hypothetical protein